jgi:CRISPR/Cas system-associated endonuclease/helicase Cas3
LSGGKTSKSLPINHADAGAAFLLDEVHISILAAIAVASHHTGLPDFVSESNRGDYMFRDQSVKEIVDAALSEYSQIHDSIINTKPLAEASMPSGDFSVFLRVLLSCLVDADHTNTATHYGRYPQQEPSVMLRPVERLARLDAYVKELGGSDKERGKLRSEMYMACKNAEVHESIASCDSPVGSGKTTAIMAHLLTQASKRGLRRIFVVLPFTNIIQQSVKVYREALVMPGEEPEDVVAELHHRADFESEDVRHLTALWRAPIIVTTAVAFFETLASNSPAALRRLHELPGSGIFIDESHAALPTKLLPVAWRWINVYAEEWSCYWVLASGSLNRFWTIKEIAGANKPNFIPELVDDDLRNRLSMYEKNRVSYQSDLGPKDTVNLCSWITSFPGPRLVVLNTVQSAAVLADYIARHFGRRSVEHLSTALTSSDRDITLERVKRRLDNKEDTDWTLIATSCVEAGVNLSFRNGFRELGSLVSLLQTSGRVNREGLHANSEIWTFCISEDGMLKRNPGIKESAAILKTYFERDRIIAPELSTQSIADEISLYGLSGLHKRIIDYEQSKNFPQVEKQFKVIDTDTRLVVVDPNVAERLRYSSVSWKELQRVTVQIAKYKLDELSTPMLLDSIYEWNLDYNNFIGYMAGIIKQGKLEREMLII